MWQDYVFSIGSVVFIIALIPTLLSKDKPPVSSSVLTGAVLFVYAVVCYSTLHFWFSFITTFLLSIQWFIIGWQKWRVNGV